MRFPEKSFLTLAFRSPLPLTLVNDGRNSIGVMAAPEEFSFSPLPTFSNSIFGIQLRNSKGQAQPQVFAPVLGGNKSAMKPGEQFAFSLDLIVEDSDITHAYEKIARNSFGFHDYRRNGEANLNATLDNMISYAMSDYAWFVDSLKGCAYSTDVPGAVKNVSSLNPLELALVTDDSVIFEKRAYPVMEYMLSREKFLFSLDSTQKIQSPSRKMDGPVAPVSELLALHSILGKGNSFLMDQALHEAGSFRIRNLGDTEAGDNWINDMHFYRATGDKAYLDKAIKGADDYLKNRVEKRQETFSDPYSGSLFFWPSFVNKWIQLSELYELTGYSRYLDAAVDGARHFTMFTWMAPGIPDSLILVNKGGKAPLYWYLKSKGHKQMEAPEALVEAWKLSETGLTPESSTTSSGHRAIFMANFAPWLLRLGYYSRDSFLMDVAKAAIIGRYQNFPGYHINTARTNVYMQKDYPLQDFENLSVNSFHYNHIMPMASMLIDYLVSDVFVRSDGAIAFPSEYIEGYAYLQNKFYGDSPGTFYEDAGVYLWMPAGLINTGNSELNYLSARKDSSLYLAFCNQSDEIIRTSITIDSSRISSTGRLQYCILNKDMKGQKGDLDKYTFKIEIEPNGFLAMRIDSVLAHVTFQDKLNAYPDMPAIPMLESEFGQCRAMVFQIGAYAKRAFIYLRDDDSKIRSVNLRYKDPSGKEKVLAVDHYPFEFTVDLPISSPLPVFYLSGVDSKGNRIEETSLVLDEQNE